MRHLLGRADVNLFVAACYHHVLTIRVVHTNMDIDMRDVSHLDEGWSFVLWDSMCNASSGSSAIREHRDCASKLSAHDDGFPVDDRVADAEEAGVVKMSVDSVLPSDASDSSGNSPLCTEKIDVCARMFLTEESIPASEQRHPSHWNAELRTLMVDKLYQWLNDRTDKFPWCRHRKQTKHPRRGSSQ